MTPYDPSGGAARPSVIVTGAAGYIGSHVTRAFLDRGWAVTALDDLSTGSRSAIPAEVSLLEMDCGDPLVEDVLRSGRFDAAVHLAGLISVDESFARPAAYYEANLLSAHRFFEAARAAGVGAVVFSSTAAVYEAGVGRPLRETDACHPASPYGRSKLAAEWVLRDISGVSKLRHVILRYFNVAGADPAGRAGPRADARHLPKLVCEAAVGARSQVTIFGDDYATPDGTGVRDYIHVSDLADIHAAAVDYLLQGGESFTGNCGYGVGFSVREVLDAARALSETPFEVVVGPRRPGDGENVMADPSLLNRKLGWRPRHDSLDAILRTGIAWERGRRRGLADLRPDGAAAAE